MLDANKVKKMLRIDGRMDALQLIQRLEDSISRKAEYLYLKAFARESSFDDEASRWQFRCLWTAYCFHHGLTVDTSEYDRELMELWDFMVKCGYPLSRRWAGFDSFDAFMCEYLV